MTRVFIDGKEGTTGLQIYERLGVRTDLEVISLPDELRKDVNARKRCINEADVVFLCLPDAAAREAVALCENPKTRIIDASTAHRTMPDWAYGFPELSAMHRQKIASSARVAVPGCHASGFVSLVYPLIAGGVASSDYPFVSYSVTGYSGGGKKMIAEYESGDRDIALDSPRQYGLGQCHKHLPEMQKICALAEPPVFSPIVSDYYSGMCVSVPLISRLLAIKYDVSAFFDYFAEYYAGQNLVKVSKMTEPYLPANCLAGKDRMQILVGGNDERILLSSPWTNVFPFLYKFVGAS